MLKKQSLKLSELEGVGPKTLEILNSLNIFDFKDLCIFLPKRYEDRQKISFIEDIVNEPEKPHFLKIKILDQKFLAIPNQKILKIYFTDSQEKYKAVLVIFQYNKANYQNVFKKGLDFYIYAKFSYQYNELQTSNFEHIMIKDSGKKNGDEDLSSDFFCILPIYVLPRIFSQKKFRKLIRQVLEILNQYSLQDILPQDIINKYSFISRKKLIHNLHFPESFETLSKAQYQFKYYEFFKFAFFIRYQNLLTIQENWQFKKAYHWNKDFENKFEKVLLNHLDFELTEEQKEVLKTIKKDLLKPTPMYRLLQGEVGCGKTIVSLLASLIPLSNNYQVALMVPSETLAKQHFKKIKEYFKELPFAHELLIASLGRRKKREIQENLKNASIRLIVGTHILFSDWVEYSNLAFVIIDEQHKFGVNQRIQLLNKNKGIDLLSMSATPIPRTLALHLYGDLTISNIYKKPKNEIITQTFCYFSEPDRLKAYQHLKQEILKGRQAFIICPIIEKSEKLDLNSVFILEKEIQNHLLPNLRVSVFHGKLSSEEKDKIMDDFINKKLDALISTNIIEVGIDIPNANCIIVEDSHRFGLAQLHQLRGRVGRGQYTSYCFFIAKENLISENGKKRLEALLKNNSGFKLAEIDLSIRGAGEFLGQQQSGAKQFKMANLVKDQDILTQCQKDIQTLLEKDSHLEKEDHKNLKKLYAYLLKNYEFHIKN